MSMDFLVPLVVFSLVSAGTPGPNNLMLMASGANYGLRRTLPHLFGVNIGFIVMVATVGFGLARVFEAAPLARTILSVACVTYLLYLAWRIATAAPPPRKADGAPEGRPFTFLQAALFQWVNPKAWAMAMTAMTVYAPGRSALAVLVTALVFGAVNLPCITAWMMLGQQMRRFLSSPRRLRVFNWTMALLLVASLYPMLALG